MFSGEFIGDVDESGAERLRGEHLPRLLVERFATEYIRAASQAGAVPWNLVPQTARGAAESIPGG
jgi:hypothetical protein